MSQPIKRIQSIHTMRRAQCATHGLQPYYTACTCVIKFGTPPHHIIRPSASKTGIGELLCTRTDHEMHEMLMVCVMCVRENGWGEVKNG
jgi:hypothetical protein